MTQLARNVLSVSHQTYKMMREIKNSPDESFDHLIKRLIETNESLVAASASTKGESK